MANDNKNKAVVPAPSKSVPGYAPVPAKKDEEKVSTPGSAAAPVMPVEDIKKEKPAEQKAHIINGDNKNSENALANFINSDNTDMDKKKEAQVNDDLDWGEKPESDSIPEKLKDLPRKYWKHQTV